MRESVEFIELTSLEKTGPDRWKFHVKPNSSFDRIFSTLIKHHVFNAATAHTIDIIHNVSISSFHHIIDDQGIWLLSHVFSNWDEMYEQATKKSPWEENWQKRAEQDIPPEHANCYTSYETERCVECGRGWIFAQHTPCSECGKPVCSTCKTKHAKTHKAEKADGPEDLERAYRLYQNDIWSKAQFQEYLNEQSQKHQTKQGDNEKQYFCFICKKQVSRLMSCAECYEHVCPECFGAHSRTHFEPKGEWKQQSYTNRQEYGQINLEDIQRIIKEMRESSAWTFSFSEDAARQAKAEAERARKQAEEEARKREQREKKDQEEFFTNFWSNQQRFYYRHEDDETDAFKAHYTNAGQQQQRTYSNSQSSSSTGTKTSVPNDIRAAFKQLGLPPAATVQEVKRAFRAKAKIAHPDAGGSEQAFKTLNAAYQLALSYAERNT